MVNDLNLEAWALPELFALNARIQRELGRRGVVRTSGAIQGELGELLALAVYGGALSTPGTKAYDLVDGRGRLVQVKTRTLPIGAHRIFRFHNLDFDVAVCIRFDRQSNDLEWAREYDIDELRSLVSPHAQGPRLPTGRAEANGRDVTATFQAAYDAMRAVGSA